MAVRLARATKRHYVCCRRHQRTHEQLRFPVPARRLLDAQSERAGRGRQPARIQLCEAAPTLAACHNPDFGGDIM